MFTVESRSLGPPTVQRTVVVVESSGRGVAGRDDFVATLTEAGDGISDAPVRVVEVETAAEARTASREEDAGRVVVVGPDAEALAAVLESETDSGRSVVAVPVSDDWHDALSQCLDAVVEGWQHAQFLHREQDLLTDALDALDDVFYIYDADGRLVRWNNRLNDVFGLDDVELAGVRAETFFVDASREQVRNAVAEALAGNDVVVEADAETESGVVRFELTGRPLVDDDGQVVGFSGVARDVTQSRRTRERLAQENEDLDAFGRVLTHDLRNPLGVATGYLEQHRESNDSPELRRVARALERMDDLIDEVRGSSHGSHLSPSTVALADVVQQAWDAVETRDALLVVDTWASVEANPRRLQRLLENLFRNCVEHAGAAPTVRVGDFDDGFFVADDGPGVPDELREDVFRTGFTTANGGTGYGLSIVRELAGMHGWRVDVTTGPSGGARVAVHGVDVDRANADAERCVGGRTDGRDRAS